MPKKPKKRKAKAAVRKPQHSGGVGLLSWMTGGKVSRAQIERVVHEQPRKYREAAKLSHLLRLRREYKWQWGAAAEYLYRELIHAYQLDDHEESLIAFVKSKPGRKQNYDLFRRIMSLKRQGHTIRQIQKSLAAEGIHLSVGAIESYLKTRRNRRQS